MEKRNGGNNKKYSDYSFTKLWKETPPGPEQKELNKLFSNNLISDDETASQIRRKYAIFAEFSPRVFNTHFKKTKAKYGAYSKLNDYRNKFD